MASDNLLNLERVSNSYGVRPLLADDTQISPTPPAGTSSLVSGSTTATRTCTAGAPTATRSTQSGPSARTAAPRPSSVRRKRRTTGGDPASAPHTYSVDSASP